MKILIISDSDRVRDFFRLEALNFKFSVDCFEKFERAHRDMSDYDLAIVDVDTVKQVPINPAKKTLTVSSVFGVADLQLPMRISELQKIYKELFSYDGDGNSQRRIEDDFKIIFYKNDKNLVGFMGKKYLLSDSEYKVLSLLCESSANEVTRAELDLLLGGEKSNISDVYICKLRQKLETPSGRKLIQTVRKKGYKILADTEWR